MRRRTALIASLEGQAGRPRPRRRTPRREDCGTSQPTSITSRPGTTSLPSSPAVRHGSRNRQREEPRNQGLFAGRQNSEHWPGGDAAGHSAEELHLRHRRRRCAGPSRKKPCRPADRPAAAFPSRCSIHPSITRAWRRLAPLWAQAAWW